MADSNVTMQGVRIIFRNFRGLPGKYNKEGERDFAVLLPDDLAQDLITDGWNVKYLKPRDEEEEEHPQAYLPVVARYDKGRPPKITLITHQGTKKRLLEEDEVEDIDFYEILNVDLIVRPYNWSHPDGRTGVRAYLQSMYITIQEDELEMKYDELETLR